MKAFDELLQTFSARAAVNDGAGLAALFTPDERFG